MAYYVGKEGERKARIVVVGLNNAGKTSVVRYLNRRGRTVDDKSPMPTIGFLMTTVVHHVDRDVLHITYFDVGGQHKMRELWPQYCRATNGLLIVVDSTDLQRIPEARREFEKLFTSVDLSSTAVLLLANKQDQPNALSPQEIAKRVGLAELGLLQWHVQGTIALDGTGIERGFEWLATTLMAPGRERVPSWGFLRKGVSRSTQPSNGNGNGTLRAVAAATTAATAATTATAATVAVAHIGGAHHGATAHTDGAHASLAKQVDDLRAQLAAAERRAIVREAMLAEAERCALDAEKAKAQDQAVLAASRSISASVSLGGSDFTEPSEPDTEPDTDEDEMPLLPLSALSPVPLSTPVPPPPPASEAPADDNDRLEAKLSASEAHAAALARRIAELDKETTELQQLLRSTTVLAEQLACRVEVLEAGGTPGSQAKAAARVAKAEARVAELEEQLRQWRSNYGNGATLATAAMEEQLRQAQMHAAHSPSPAAPLTLPPQPTPLAHSSIRSDLPLDDALNLLTEDDAIEWLRSVLPTASTLDLRKWIHEAGGSTSKVYHQVCTPTSPRSTILSSVVSSTLPDRLGDAPSRRAPTHPSMPPSISPSIPQNGLEGFEGSEGPGAFSHGTLEEVEAERLVAKERLRVALERLEAERLEVAAAVRLEAERRDSGAVSGAVSSPHLYSPQLMPLGGGRWLTLDPPTSPPDHAPVTALVPFGTSLSATSLASINKHLTTSLSSAGDGPEQDDDAVLRI